MRHLTTSHEMKKSNLKWINHIVKCRYQSSLLYRPRYVRVCVCEWKSTIYYSGWHCVIAFSAARRESNQQLNEFSSSRILCGITVSSQTCWLTILLDRKVSDKYSNYIITQTQFPRYIYLLYINSENLFIVARVEGIEIATAWVCGDYAQVFW